MNPSCSASGSKPHPNEDITMGPPEFHVSQTHTQPSRKRRRTRRLTLPKKKREIEVDDGGISVKAFNKLPHIDLLKLPILNTEDGKVYHHFFANGDDITVNSIDDETDNAWVCKILDMRAEVKQKRVWLNVAWYYSANDIIASINQLYSEPGAPPINVDHQYILDHLPKQTTPNDRFLSNDTKFLSANVVQGQTTIYPYVEFYEGTTNFGPDDFYSRGFFDAESKTITDETYIPFPVSENNTDSGYDTPAPVRPNPQEAWRCCPRCGKWYHQRCLEENSPDAETNAIGPPYIRRLAVDPCSKFLHPMFASYTYPIPPRGKLSSVTANGGNPWDSVLERLKHLPPGLVKMAQQPILKYPGVDSKMSVMGNLKDVILARMICYQELDGGVEDHGSDGSDDEMEIETETERGRKDKGKGKQRAEQKSALKWRTTKIFACPYIPYWEKLYPSIPDDNTPSVSCPDCKALI
ncbi:hypothetical protein QCA50_013154 [Cerrena zonata]|uniref:BAH domain-containing protein n=1 Tax=Cerrena zonata TaxID=2478898 RepID=A0AAW0G1I6_9APHY